MSIRNKMSAIIAHLYQSLHLTPNIKCNLLKAYFILFIYFLVNFLVLSRVKELPLILVDG